MSSLIDESILGNLQGVTNRIEAGDNINQKGVFRYQLLFLLNLLFIYYALIRFFLV